jgi:aquaporin Z
MSMSLSKRALAELFGTFWLVFGGIGTAVIAAKFSGGTGLGNIGVGFLGVAFAFGLTVVTMAYAIGPISGAHLNPAVSFGLWVGQRFPARDLVAYVIAQVIGAIAGAAVLYAIATGTSGFSLSAGFGAELAQCPAPDEQGRRTMMLRHSQPSSDRNFAGNHARKHVN